MNFFRAMNVILQRKAGKWCRLVIAALPALAAGAEGSPSGFAESESPAEELIVEETFEATSGKEDGIIRGAHRWWAEGGERVWVEDGRLHVQADAEQGHGGVATVWCETAIAGDVRVEIDAHVVSSSIGANNINVFLFYSDPSGKPLLESRESRSDGAYRHYHDLNGYIVTFLRDYREEMGVTANGDPNARFRLRRCPGFRLVEESYDPMGVEAGRTYRLTITRRGGTITFDVDGKRFLEWEDEDPLREGLLGLRTFRTYLWWDNIRVYQLAEE